MEPVRRLHRPRRCGTPSGDVRGGHLRKPGIFLFPPPADHRFGFPGAHRGSFEVVIWRQDEVPPDDAALLRVAEQVLPTVPGWTAG
ncbi:hypothetical protein [Streptomyces sp. NPDC058475]|uniref:hypothetical protein n=1 Tax=unclassified Streptomyces TaxID=2593676 RepID=UPI003659E8E4